MLYEVITVQEAAQLMVEKRVPSMLIINEKKHPLGILTHRDIVQRIIVQGENKCDPISKYMSSPVVTVESGSSSTAALLLMLQKRIGQVCVTEDGTDKTELLDVCTEKDLLAQTGHHPAGLLREIKAAVITSYSIHYTKLYDVRHFDLIYQLEYPNKLHLSLKINRQ